MAGTQSLREALDLHRLAADELSAAAAAVPADRWNEPIAEGKWSPALLVAHLIATYDVLLGELRGGPGMRVLTKWWQRVLLRAVLVPKLLAGKAFPKNARAPRETRPPDAPLERDAAIAMFHERMQALDEEARNADPSKKLTHAYFGSASLAKGVTLCARHIQHHRAQMPCERTPV